MKNLTNGEYFAQWLSEHIVRNKGKIDYEAVESKIDTIMHFSQFSYRYRDALLQIEDMTCLMPDDESDFEDLCDIVHHKASLALWNMTGEERKDDFKIEMAERDAIAEAQERG